MTTSSTCRVPKRSATRRAWGSSLNAASRNPIEKVWSGPLVAPAQAATTTLESTPPLRKAPTGTSAIRCSRTASSSLARMASCQSSAEGRSSGSSRSCQ